MATPRERRPYSPQGGRSLLHWETPIQFLKGVGERRAELFHRLGIRTVGELLYHVPHRYEDASTLTSIRAVEPGVDATVLGRVISKGVLPTRRGLRVFQAVVKDESGMIEVAWPGQVFLDRVIHKDDVLLLSGPCRFYHGRQLQPREWVNFGKDDGQARGQVLSVYDATEGLTVRQIRALILQHLDAMLGLVQEHLPPELLTAAGVPPLVDALRMVHRPASLTEAHEGRARLAFDEFFFAHVLHRRANALARGKRAGVAFQAKRTLTQQLKGNLPFALTKAQVRSIREIADDMGSPARMHRLLQGDVGSGKTVVALFAALLAMENDVQVALMVPTELLAEQHARTLTRLLQPLGIAPVLVTGGLGAAERRRVNTLIASTTPLLIVGTHALLTEQVVYQRLGLAIIDEQHRFGVEQRALLSGKGEAPDVLLMSATPIPRSLALTVYGDLDVSTLDERPPGRQPVTTALRPEKARDKVLQFVDSQIAQGRQAYVVYPVIEESEKTDLKAATTMFEELSSGPFAARRVELLHGRLPQQQRDDIMRRFRDGDVDMLVATTVIEVGIDVPNASVMLIEHPERFGLSQLHQLRGRVGRGAEQSFCILLGNVGEEAGRRLSIFVATEDGFEIARADLRLRGMGDLFGQKQSGDAPFKVGDPVRDEAINMRARTLAVQTLESDPELASAAHAGIRRLLRMRYKRALELFRVG